MSSSRWRRTMIPPRESFASVPTRTRIGAALLVPYSCGTTTPTAVPRRRRFAFYRSSSSSSSSHANNDAAAAADASSSPQQQRSLPFAPQHRTHFIFGANTDVGKTLVAAGLVRARWHTIRASAKATGSTSNSSSSAVHYLKPLQCGGSDEAFVRRYADMAAPLPVDKNEAQQQLWSTRILFQWDTPASPHAASILEQHPGSDAQVQHAVQEHLWQCQTIESRTISSTTTYIETAGGVLSPSAASPENTSPHHAQTSIVPNNNNNNSNNGSTSSSTSWGWTTQADLYQPWSTLAPVVLVGDGRLGGISATLTALESLLLRGYTVAALVMIAQQSSHASQYDNLSAVRDYLNRRYARLRNGAGEPVLLSSSSSSLLSSSSSSIVSLPPIPDDPTVPLDDWFTNETATQFTQLDQFLQQQWAGHVADVRQTVRIGEGAANAVWWPGTSNSTSTTASTSTASTSAALTPNRGDDHDDNSKEGNLNKEDKDDAGNGPAYVDRATGEYMQVIGPGTTTSTNNNNHINHNNNPYSYSYSNLYDASASWWTHGVRHGDSALALAVGAAGGRYGHVSGHVLHAPAVTLAQTLRAVLGKTSTPTSANNNNNDNSRVFFTDGSSSAVEAAIQMGLRTYQKRLNMSSQEFLDTDWIVAGQEDCYHGDTLGALNVGEAYFDRDHPWYQSKGLCLSPPTIGFRQARLVITLPPGMTPDPEVSYEFDSIKQVLDVEARCRVRGRDKKNMKSLYQEMIAMQWLAHEHITQQKIGAVLLEPVLLATGGMKFVDPLWQSAMVELARTRDIPVVWDETTVGLYRLGVASCARDILRVTEPDIVIVSKLLTGGTIPLSAVIAKEEVFDAVVGGGVGSPDDVGQSLANGNTMAANPVACVSALQALAAYRVLEEDEHATRKVRPWLWKGPRLLFDEEATRALSELPWVEQSFTLGSLLTIKLHSRSSSSNGNEHDDDDNNNDDEKITRANLVVKELKAKGVLAQPFGDVVYIMSSPLARNEECTTILNILHSVIDRLSRDESGS